jgi:hypothetical protein
MIAAQQRPNIGRIILGSVVDKDEKENMSFDQAGAGIMDEDDQKKLEDMKGFVDDGNPDVSGNSPRLETIFSKPRRGQMFMACYYYQLGRSDQLRGVAGGTAVPHG